MSTQIPRITQATQQQILQASASWNNYLVDEISAGLRVQKLDLVFGTINTMLFGLDRIVLDRIVIVFFGARAVMSGSLTVGMLVAFLAYKDQFSQARRRFPRHDSAYSAYSPCTASG